MAKTIITCLSVLLILWGGVFIINETDFLYHEPQGYTLSKESQWFSPEVAPLFINTPGHDQIILFIHGYQSTPHDLRAIARHFSKTYDVALPLLPGHGTSEVDFQKTYYAQWYGYANDLYHYYRKQYKKVYICGFSMGGTIALNLAENNRGGMAPDGVVTLSAPVFLNHLWGSGILYDWRLYFSRMASWFLVKVSHPIPSSDGDGAHEIGYEGTNYIKQVHSLKLAMNRTRHHLSRIKAPILLMQAMGDRTVPFANMAYIARHVKSKLVMTKAFDLSAWSHRKHLIPLYNTTQPQVIKEMELFLDKINDKPAKQEIKDRSHAHPRGTATAETR